MPTIDTDPSPTHRRAAVSGGELDRLSDRALVERVVDVLTAPPADPPDSFVLHAPLELMARAELLPHVVPERRPDARRRIADIAATWLAFGPAADDPDPSQETGVDLAVAIRSGSLDDTDRAVTAIARKRTTDEFVGHATDVVLPYLGGAAHATIFLDQLSRFPRPPRPAAAAMGRTLLRDLARHPDWTLAWIDQLADNSTAEHRSLDELLAAPPSAGDPGSNFIYPTMHLVDTCGLAAELLSHAVATTPVAGARRQLLRIAAMSMLQDDPRQAPYGWTHCLTMAQATLAVAHHASDRRRAIAVAATYVLGFRATQSTTGVDPQWEPPRRSTTTTRLLDGTPNEAAAATWHSTDRGELVGVLATEAACHPDAHLAKYTLACVHEAHHDPVAAHLYLAAAAYLAAWWRQHDEQPADQPSPGHRARRRDLNDPNPSSPRPRLHTEPPSRPGDPRHDPPPPSI